ncbi:apolipoprotein N-acyltransferase [Shewanella dokdonensis]|uniref:Apolipoprotein N-acyltransferase n=1 Tax=Shewanella dokdonensis TaxID=712036 RepID=A0ABX8DCR5_9GAMM|nr:apolipoprotein N-acyltransferase [Shewanella dokdonensis]MCL1073728.1 apolipoprotein N-acyltransferase [Shewanella dokdonensis]QVK22553.1 apolipoprotein N-acyltransferase [Shewanella dokdonensis]
MILSASRIRQSPWLNAVLAFVAGAATSLSFAPYDLWPIYPLALALVLWLSCREQPKRAFYLWLSFGFGSFAFGISWVHVSIYQYGGMPLPVSMLLMALLALYLALYPALAGALWAKLASRWAWHWNALALFPALWVLTEWLRGWMLTGFPWLWAGYSQSSGPLQPLAAYIGTLGISLLLAMFAGSLVLLLRRRWISLPILMALMALAVWQAPRHNGIERTGQTVSVALVQGNIPQSMKWDPNALWPTLLKYMDLSRPHFDKDIIIWPEAAIPAPESMVEPFLDNANKVANLNDTAIISGIVSLDQSDFYNSLIVLGNAHQHQQTAGDYQVNGSNQYRKHHLLPIGEFVPFESLLRPLAPLFNLPMSSFSRGAYVQPNLQAGGFRLAPAICYEIAFPEQLRDNVTADTQLLLTVSNDAWFGASNGPLQHLEIAQMRAAELGRPLLRDTNNGVTAIVDEHGNISAKLPQFQDGVLTANVALVSGITPFAKWGQWPVLIFSLLLLLFSLLLIVNRKHK